MLLGASGAGKTHSIVTLVEAGIKPCIIFTEQGMSTIGKALKEHKLPEDSVAWRYISPASANIANMIAMAKNVNRLSFEAVTKLTDPHRTEYMQWVSVLEALNNFVDDRTGESYGNVGQWSTDRALVIDSLTGLSNMAMSLVVGSRPTRGQQDWQVAQNNLYNLLQWLTNELKCHFVLTGHLEREMDEVSGAIHLMASTLGRKLAPKLPPMFDEVVMAKHLIDKRVWSTVEGNADLRQRLLPESSTLPPSFVPFIEAWKEAGGIISSKQAE